MANLRYVPGKGGGVKRSKGLGDSRSLKIPVGVPGAGRGARVGFLPQTGQVAVTTGTKVFRRKLYER